MYKVVTQHLGVRSHIGFMAPSPDKLLDLFSEFLVEMNNQRDLDWQMTAVAVPRRQT